MLTCSVTSRLWRAFYARTLLLVGRHESLHAVVPLSLSPVPGTQVLWTGALFHLFAEREYSTYRSHGGNILAVSAAAEQPDLHPPYGRRAGVMFRYRYRESGHPSLHSLPTSRPTATLLLPCKSATRYIALLGMGSSQTFTHYEISLGNDEKPQSQPLPSGTIEPHQGRGAVSATPAPSLPPLLSTGTVPLDRTALPPRYANNIPRPLGVGCLLRGYETRGATNNRTRQLSEI